MRSSQPFRTDLKEGKVAVKGHIFPLLIYCFSFLYKLVTSFNPFLVLLPSVLSLTSSFPIAFYQSFHPNLPPASHPFASLVLSLLFCLVQLVHIFSLFPLPTLLFFPLVLSVVSSSFLLLPRVLSFCLIPSFVFPFYFFFLLLSSIYIFYIFPLTFLLFLWQLIFPAFIVNFFSLQAHSSLFLIFFSSYLLPSSLSS